MPREQEEKNRIREGTLYLVSTPIGNLADISERAKKVLNGVDFIAAEDTRNTLKLLMIYGISRPLISYHEHNRRERGAEIADRLAAGESCALVTDAGTPAISDPGATTLAFPCFPIVHQDSTWPLLALLHPPLDPGTVPLLLTRLLKH